jgi:hypothetical protein
MNLYLVEWKEGGGYDTFSAFVCSAKNENAARLTLPEPNYHNAIEHRAWTSHPEKLIVRFLGTAAEGTMPATILARFHAG